MPENTIEKRDNLINPPDSREAGFESPEQTAAAEVLRAKEAAGHAKESAGQEVLPTIPTPRIETILERPQLVVADEDPKLQEALTRLDQAKSETEATEILSGWISNNKLSGDSKVKLMDKAQEKVKKLQDAT